MVLNPFLLLYEGELKSLTKDVWFLTETILGISSLAVLGSAAGLVGSISRVSMGSSQTSIGGGADSLFSCSLDTGVQEALKTEISTV